MQIRAEPGFTAGQGAGVDCQQVAQIRERIAVEDARALHADAVPVARLRRRAVAIEVRVATRAVVTQRRKHNRVIVGARGVEDRAGANDDAHMRRALHDRVLRHGDACARGDRHITLDDVDALGIPRFICGDCAGMPDDAVVDQHRAQQFSNDCLGSLVA